MADNSRVSAETDESLRSRMEALAARWEAQEPACTHRVCGHIFCEFAGYLRKELDAAYPPATTEAERG